MEQKQARSAPLLQTSCHCDRPVKNTVGANDVRRRRRFNHDQVRSAEAALPLAALCRALRSDTNGSNPEAAAGLAQEAKKKQLTHINTPIKQSAKPYKGTESSGGQTQKGSNIDFISVVSAGDTLHIAFQ